jgi:hypothetical protein
MHKGGVGLRPDVSEPANALQALMPGASARALLTKKGLIEP